MRRGGVGLLARSINNAAWNTTPSPPAALSLPAAALSAAVISDVIIHPDPPYESHAREGVASWRPSKWHPPMAPTFTSTVPNFVRYACKLQQKMNSKSLQQPIWLLLYNVPRGVAGFLSSIGKKYGIKWFSFGGGRCAWSVSFIGDKCWLVRLVRCPFSPLSPLFYNRWSRRARRMCKGASRFDVMSANFLHFLIPSPLIRIWN